MTIEDLLFMLALAMMGAGIGLFIRANKMAKEHKERFGESVWKR